MQRKQPPTLQTWSLPDVVAKKALTDAEHGKDMSVYSTYVKNLPYHCQTPATENDDETLADPAAAFIAPSITN